MTALLTPAEAAARIGVCVKTLRKFREHGLIPYVAVTDRKIMYRPQDCEAYLESRVRREATNAWQKPKPTRKRRASPHGAAIIPFTARRATTR